VTLFQVHRTFDGYDATFEGVKIRRTLHDITSQERRNGGFPSQNDPNLLVIFAPYLILDVEMELL
jgi:hypothetical protein